MPVESPLVYFPNWLDERLYPFNRRYFETKAGWMNYVDTGEGPPVVLLHGNPTWSFMYRHLIAGLSDRFRCIAPDLIGFGLSDKPHTWSYRPEAQAEVVASLLDNLNLSDATLVAHDYGGPIGFSYLQANPDRFSRMVLFNTWMWPLDNDPWMIAFSRSVGGPIGRRLCERTNAFVRVNFRLAFHDRSRLTRQAYRHYVKAMPKPADRKGTWVFAESLIESSSWFKSLWKGREALTNLPTLLIWGMKDPLVRIAYLRHWESILPHRKTIELDSVGHYVPEEAGEDIVPTVRDFLIG